MSVILMIAAAAGLMVSVILLLKELFPGSKNSVELLEDLTQKGLGRVRTATKKGQAYMEIANRVLDGSEAFLKALDLPPIISDRSNKVIQGLRQYTQKADSLVHHQGLIKLLAMVSPASAKFFGEVREGYTYVITEDRNQPFQINQEISEVAQKITEGIVFEEEKARAIFDWFIRNISYGQSGRKKYKKGYRHAAEVFTDREGVCGEMAILFVCMARAVGMQANYVLVEIDCFGDKVGHACAGVKVNGKLVLIDTAYYTYAIKHQVYQVYTDQEAVPHFKAMRGN